MSNVDNREIPDLPWKRTLVLVAAVFVVCLGAWEAHWRGQGARPSFRNSDGLWTMVRRRVEAEGTNAIAMVGSSRILFDMDLETWEEETGRVPIQLALEGTNPRPFLTDLANDEGFSGVLVVGITPTLFFAPEVGLRESVIQYRVDESPSQRVNQRISMQLEQRFAFYDPDFAAFTVLRRQAFWPEREGKQWTQPLVRKLANLTVHRHSQMWSKVEDDPVYNKIATDTWAEFLNNPPPQPPPDVAQAYRQQVLDEVKRDVDAIRARGGEVVFLRLPSTDPFRAVERQALPRPAFWDAVLDHTDAVGVHFEDYPELMNVSVPEWSHVSMRDAPRLTREIIGILRAELAERGVTRSELSREASS